MDLKENSAPSRLAENKEVDPPSPTNRVDDQVLVFRLANRKMFPPGNERPDRAVFSLSSEDKKQTPPTLSVWDAAQTTLAEAQAHHDTTHSSFAFNVGEARRVSEDRVDVLREPVGGPGGDGHCGVTGLNRPPSAPKSIYRAMKLHLADISFRYP